MIQEGTFVLRLLDNHPKNIKLSASITCQFHASYLPIGLQLTGFNHGLENIIYDLLHGTPHH